MLHLAHPLVACLQALAAAAAPAPARQTLDHLRADLSHEMAAKHARLAALIRDWRAGRLHDGDAGAAAALTTDMARLYRRHARAAAATLPTFVLLVDVLSRLAALRRAALTAAGSAQAAAAAATGCERALAALTTASRRLVEQLSQRHAARFGELATAVTDEMRREASPDVAVTFESADGGAAHWVPRADAARWSDLLRNLVRNAVQATAELATVEPVAPKAPVVVRLQPLPAPGGTRFEVEDGGVGMSDEQLASMWLDGFTRHGRGHGVGLTAAKRSFLEERATIAVRTAPGVGTLVRVDLEARDVTFGVPRRWLAPPLVLPLLLVLSVAALGAAQARRGEMMTVRVSNEHLVTALDAHGRTLWQRQFTDRVRPNWRSTVQAERPESTVEVPQLLVDDARGRRLVILVTTPDQGAGRVLALDDRGRERWSRPLRWTAPRVTRTGNLTSAFQARALWNPDSRPVIMLNVRDGNWSSTAIQFLSTEGDSLGAYLHPGHLEFFGTADFDEDGRSEVILNGKNNDAPRDTLFWPGEPLPDDAYGECLVLLETPQVCGQAYPSRRWPAQPVAREDAYLLVPPLTMAGFADPRLSTITRLVTGKAGGGGAPRLEVYLADGRIYTLDGRLRPLSCTAGDHTPASEFGPARPVAPLLHFRDGRGESIDLPVARGDS